MSSPMLSKESAGKKHAMWKAKKFCHASTAVDCESYEII
jgi:hypothetical protein